MSQKILFVGEYCPFCVKVERFIEQNNIEGIEIRDVSKDRKDRDFLLREGGKIQLPCLFVDGKAMYESDDIIRYLGALYLWEK